LLSIIILILFSIPAVASAAINLNNLSSPTLKASDDYATDTFADPWDMSNTEDVWPAYWNVSGATFANGTFTATSTTSNPYIYFLWGGYPNSIDSGRDGKARPIDAGAYSKVAVRMYSSNNGTAKLWWFYEQDLNINRASVSFPVTAGWHIYILNNVSDFGMNWTEKPITLRIDPINVSGASFSIDWVKAGKAADAITSLSWNDTSSAGYEAFIDDDQSGYDGASLGAVSTTAGSANYSLQAIAPGNYYLYLKKDSDPTPSNYIPVTISRPPTVKITDPDVGGGADWATEVLGDPWDMSNSTDVSGTKNVTGRGYNNGNYTGVNTNNDPIVYLNFHGRKIDTSRYHRLTFKYKFDGTYDLVRGTMSRAGWSKTFSKGWQMTDDLLTYEGWNVLSLSLKGVGLDVGNYGWKSQMSYFRFDPHEDAYGARRFYIDYVRIAADDELTNKAFDIRYTTSDTDNSSLTLTLNADKDKTPGNGNEQAIYSGTVGIGDGSFHWTPAGNFNGDYYIQATVNDGLKSTSSYSSGPLHVDTYKPRTYGKKVVARRASKKRAPRYLQLYKAYSSKYKREKNKTLRKRYKSAARRYYIAYRRAIKQIAIANIRFYVKDPYSDKATSTIKLQKAIRSKKTKKIVYKTTKIIRFGLGATNTWRIYKFETSIAGTNKYIIYAKDRAGNTAQQVRNGTLIVK